MNSTSFPQQSLTRRFFNAARVMGGNRGVQAGFAFAGSVAAALAYKQLSHSVANSPSMRRWEVSASKPKNQESPQIIKRDDPVCILTVQRPVKEEVTQNTAKATPQSVEMEEESFFPAVDYRSEATKTASEFRRKIAAAETPAQVTQLAKEGVKTVFDQQSANPEVAAVKQAYLPLNRSEMIEAAQNPARLVEREVADYQTDANIFNAIGTISERRPEEFRSGNFITRVFGSLLKTNWITTLGKNRTIFYGKYNIIPGVSGSQEVVKKLEELASVRSYWMNHHKSHDVKAGVGSLIDRVADVTRYTGQGYQFPTALYGLGKKLGSYSKPHLRNVGDVFRAAGSILTSASEKLKTFI